MIFGAGFPVAEQLTLTSFSEFSALSELGIRLASTLGSDMAVEHKVTKSVTFCLHLSNEHLLPFSPRMTLASNLDAPSPEPQQ